MLFFFFIGNKNFIKNLKKTPQCIKYALAGGKDYKQVKTEETKKQKQRKKYRINASNTLNSIE